VLVQRFFVGVFQDWHKHRHVVGSGEGHHMPISPAFGLWNHLRPSLSVAGTNRNSAIGEGTVGEELITFTMQEGVDRMLIERLVAEPRHVF